MSCVLLISPEPWHAQWVSKHHYARELVRRGHDVLFFGPPERHGTITLELIEQLNLEGASGRLRVLRSPRVAPALRFMPAPMRRVLESRWLHAVEQVAGQPIDAVWNFENSRFFDMGFAGKRLTIYQQVDLNQHFNPLRAAATADLTIAICEPIEQQLAPVAKKLLRLAHGHANADVVNEVPNDVEVAFQRLRTNAVYIGNLDIVYLDVPLLAQLVADHPETCFHFVGTYTAGKGLHASLGHARNSRFWGHQPREMLPAFLTRADVQLIAYRADQHPEQLANPHKLMEYLAAGRCVLATWTQEYVHRPDLVVMANNHGEYRRRFAEIVADPKSWNNEQQVAHRQAFAQNHTYPRQLDRIVQALASRGYLIA